MAHYLSLIGVAPEKQLLHHITYEQVQEALNLSAPQRRELIRALFIFLHGDGSRFPAFLNQPGPFPPTDSWLAPESGEGPIFRKEVETHLKALTALSSEDCSTLQNQIGTALGETDGFTREMTAHVHDWKDSLITQEAMEPIATAAMNLSPQSINWATAGLNPLYFPVGSLKYSKAPAPIFITDPTEKLRRHRHFSHYNEESPDFIGFALNFASLFVNEDGTIDQTYLTRTMRKITSRLDPLARDTSQRFWTNQERAALSAYKRGVKSAVRQDLVFCAKNWAAHQSFLNLARYSARVIVCPVISDLLFHLTNLRNAHVEHTNNWPRAQPADRAACTTSLQADLKALAGCLHQQAQENIRTSDSVPDTLHLLLSTNVAHGLNYIISELEKELGSFFEEDGHEYIMFKVHDTSLPPEFFSPELLFNNVLYDIGNRLQQEVNFDPEHRIAVAQRYNLSPSGVMNSEDWHGVIALIVKAAAKGHTPSAPISLARYPTALTMCEDLFKMLPLRTRLPAYEAQRVKHARTMLERHLYRDVHKTPFLTLPCTGFHLQFNTTMQRYIYDYTNPHPHTRAANPSFPDDHLLNSKMLIMRRLYIDCFSPTLPCW